MRHKSQGRRSVPMRFEGDQLRAILAYQTEPVVVRDGFGRPEVEYADPRAALAVLRRGNYYGVGHAKRIRFVQPDSVEDRVVPWGAEVDFGAPCGAGFQYVSVRTGRPKQRVNGAKRSKFVRPSRLTKSSMTVVDAPSEGPATASMQLDSQRRQPHHPVKKDGFGVNIAHPLIREHRPIPGARK